jgi:hypothetical protein
LEIEVARAQGQKRLSREQVSAVVDQMARLTALLREADPRDPAEV